MTTSGSCEFESLGFIGSAGLAKSSHYLEPVASLKKSTKSLAFDEVFVRIRPSVLFVKNDDIAEYLYDPISSQIEAEICETPESEDALAMTSCHIVVSAFLDGGIAFVENEWGDDDSREAAFEEWVREREAAGEDWDENDFDHEVKPNFEGPPLMSGCYIAGEKAIAHILGLLDSEMKLRWKNIHRSSTEADPASISPKFNTSAKMIASAIQACRWDDLVNR